MSNFITLSDYKSQIRDNQLQMIIDADDTILDSVENTAIAIVKDALHLYYDTDMIFATTDSNRPAQVVRWCVVLAAYFLHERIPDKLVPDRIVKNYDQVMDTLTMIADKKLSVDLPVKKDDELKPLSKFRWGGNTQRDQQT